MTFWFSYSYVTHIYECVHTNIYLYIFILIHIYMNDIWHIYIYIYIWHIKTKTLTVLSLSRGKYFPLLRHVHLFNICKNMYYFFIQDNLSTPSNVILKSHKSIFRGKKDERTDIFLRLFAVFYHFDVSWKAWHFNIWKKLHEVLTFQTSKI